MTRSLKLLSFLAVFWVLLSGYFSFLLLAFGAVSCLLVVWISSRMDLMDHDVHPLNLRPLKLAGYLGWLLWEVVKSNIGVARRILSPGLPIQPTLLDVPTSQRTELGQVIFANSITLTPGTVSIDLQKNRIRVHALATGPAEDLQRGVMDRKVRAVERVAEIDPGGRPG